MATPAQRKAFAQKAKKAAAQVNAFYRRPAGVFYCIMDKAGGSFGIPYLQTHPYVENTFVNMSTSNADLTYNWQVQLYDSQAKARKWYSAASKDIKVTYGYEADSVPILTAKAGAVSDTYSVYAYKNDNKYQARMLALPNNMEAFGSQSGLTSNLLAMSHYVASSDRRGAKKYMWTYSTIANEAGDDLGYWFGHNTWTDSKGNVKPFNLVGAAFEKPEHPYVLNKVYGWAGFVELKSGANVTLTAKVYKLDDLKQYDDSASVGYGTEACAKLEDNLIATGTCTLNAASIIGDKYAMLEFPLETEVDGIPMEIAPEIDSPILVTITGYDDPNIKSLTFFMTSDDEDEGFGELAYIGRASGAVPTTIYGLNNFFGNEKGIISKKGGMSIMLDVETPYIVYNYSNETGEVNFPAAGGSKSVEIFSYKNSEDWNTTLADGSDIPDWLHISYVDGTGDSEGLVTATVKADAYPAGQQGGRRADVKFGFPGAHLTYIVRQNDQSGVDEVTVSGVQAYAANGNLYVNVKGAENAGELNVYNVAGKLVKTAVLSEGTNILDAQDLAKGVYMLQFGNNTVKVVK